MRGKASVTITMSFSSRITPAYAGKSSVACIVFQFGRDHPRLCGEKISMLRTWFSRLGSPPPMRGKVLQILNGRIIFRITPAYAGKSQDPRCGWLQK